MKKLNKFFAVLVALAMMAMLSVTAFAVDTKPAGQVIPENDQDDYASANAKLVKVLTLADGVTKPADVTFTFEFAVDPNYTSTTTTAAEAAQAIVAPKGTLTISTNDMTKTAYEGDGNSVAYAVDIASAFGTFPKAGVYNYKVSEKQDAATGEHFKWTYDTGSYDVDLYVVDNGTTRTINNIVVTSEDGKEKTTIVPTEETSKDLGDPTAYGCTFENTYSKNNVSPEPLTPENAVLNINKTVTGDFGDKTAQAFPFTLNITAPEGANMTEATAVVFAGNTAKTPAETYTIKLDGSDNTFVLKHNEKLLFAELPAGTTYTVTEDLNKQTTAGTYDVKNYDKYTANWDGGTNETAGAPQTSVSKTIKDDATSQKTAACVNAYDDESTTPTGILISNLPYIALALVAIGGLVAYVVVRRRNADEA